MKVAIKGGSDQGGGSRGWPACLTCVSSGLSKDVRASRLTEQVVEYETVIDVRRFADNAGSRRSGGA